jgi:hypothetical protein
MIDIISDNVYNLLNKVCIKRSVVGMGRKKSPFEKVRVNLMLDKEVYERLKREADEVGLAYSQLANLILKVSLFAGEDRVFDLREYLQEQLFKVLRKSVLLEKVDNGTLKEEIDKALKSVSYKLKKA